MRTLVLKEEFINKRKNKYNKSEDLSGKIIDYLTVIERNMEQTRLRHMPIWECKCICGNIIYRNTQNLSTENTKFKKSCGCIKVSQIPKVDLTGKKFGHLTVKEFIGSTIVSGESKRLHMWKCECDCGNIISKSYSYLKNKSIKKSCGCKVHEPIHNMNKSSEYKIWSAMKQRCYNPKAKHYKSYGGRGITVYEPWKNSFIEFYNYIGPRPSKNHSIDRMNVNGNYEPGNIRWVTQELQNKNKRKISKSNTGLIGITKIGKKYYVTIGRTRLGSFKNIDDAIAVRQKAEEERDYYK